MSRIRYIKPGFFTDDDLGDCQPLARILFAGLWTIADREGRLEDRPKRIKAECLPYDECDANALLDELAAHGTPPLIVRYHVDGLAYIAIPGWQRHQKPHSRELPSAIPSPAEHDLGRAQASPRQCPSTTPAVPSPASRARVTGTENGERRTENGVKSVVESPSDSTSDEVCSGEALPAKRANGDGFAAFWTAYPNKQGRLAAERRWKSLSRADRAAATEVAVAMAYCVECGYRERDKCPHGSTFLNQRRYDEWLSEDGELRAPPGYGPPQNGGGPSVYDRIDAVGRRMAAERGEEWP